MRIIGIDPGYAIVGVGVIERMGGSFEVIHHEAIITDSSLSLPLRLKRVSEELAAIIAVYYPEVMAVEELFFSDNRKTAITVGHARGVILLEGARAGLEVYEYTPVQVKQAVVGYGRAEKIQVQKMVKSILGMEEVPKPDDVADALAVAICHGNSVSVAYAQTETKMQVILRELREGSQQKNMTWEQVAERQLKNG